MWGCSSAPRVHIPPKALRIKALRSSRSPDAGSSAHPADSDLASRDTSAFLKVRTNTLAPCGQYTIACMLASWQSEFDAAMKFQQHWFHLCGRTSHLKENDMVLFRNGD